MAAIAPWFCLHIPSCGPGFKSQAHHLCFFRNSTAVWPNVGIQVPNFTKEYPGSSQSNFYLKIAIFQKSPNSQQTFGPLLCNKRSLKIAHSGHTDFNCHAHLWSNRHAHSTVASRWPPSSHLLSLGPWNCKWQTILFCKLDSSFVNRVTSPGLSPIKKF